MKVSSETTPRFIPRVFALQPGLPAQALLNAVVENGSSVIFLKDTEDRYLLVNRHFEAMFRVSRENILGRTDHEVFPQHIADSFAENDRLVLERESPLEFEELAEYGDGVHTSIVLKFPWYHSDRSLGGVGGIAVDITDRLRAEQERQQLEAKMLQAQKLESLGILAGGIAHDFNNLLAAILANADLALRKLPADAPSRHSVQQIELIALRAADLTRQMLAYAGRGSLRTQRVQLSQLVEEMASLLQSVVSKKATVVTAFAPKLSGVAGDPTQLRQVVMNLLTNASEALGDNEGTITLSTGELDATTEQLQSPFFDTELSAGRYAYFEVADTGSGMSEGTMAKMFDPFFTTKFTGRGLGLAAVLGIVRAHHGTLHVNSTIGQGTTFRVLLPAAQCAAPSTSEKKRPRPVVLGGNVLLVDDEPTVRTAVHAMLEEYGFTVTEASDGNQAIALLSKPHDFVAVLLDATMPGLSGEEVLRSLGEAAGKAPIVITSGHDEQELRKRFAGLAVKATLHKPFRGAQLLEALELCFQK